MGGLWGSPLPRFIKGGHGRFPERCLLRIAPSRALENDARYATGCEFRKRLISRVVYLLMRLGHNLTCREGNPSSRPLYQLVVQSILPVIPKKKESKLYWGPKRAAATSYKSSLSPASAALASQARQRLNVENASFLQPTPVKRHRNVFVPATTPAAASAPRVGKAGTRPIETGNPAMVDEGTGCNSSEEVCVADDEIAESWTMKGGEDAGSVVQQNGEYMESLRMDLRDAPKSDPWSR